MIVVALLLHMATVPNDACAWSTWGAERIVSGIYIDEFEAQAFYEGVTSLSEIRSRNEAAWVNADEAVHPAGFRKLAPNRVYRIEAIVAESFPPDETVRSPIPCPPRLSDKSIVKVLRFAKIEDIGAFPSRIPLEVSSGSPR